MALRTSTKWPKWLVPNCISNPSSVNSRLGTAKQPGGASEHTRSHHILHDYQGGPEISVARILLPTTQEQGGGLWGGCVSRHWHGSRVPALLSRMCRGCPVARNSAAAARTDASDVKSQCRVCRRPRASLPPPSSAATASTTPAVLAALRAANHTEAPPRAKTRAASAPMPPDAPARRPCKLGVVGWDDEGRRGKRGGGADGYAA